MNYLKPSFSVAVGSDAYRANWDAVFGKLKTCRIGDHAMVPVPMCMKTKCSKCGLEVYEESLKK